MYIYTYIKIPKFLRYEKTSSRVTSILYFVYGVIHSYHRTVKQEKYRGNEKEKKREKKKRIARRRHRGRLSELLWRLIEIYSDCNARLCQRVTLIYTTDKFLLRRCVNKRCAVIVHQFRVNARRKYAIYYNPRCWTPFVSFTASFHRDWDINRDINIVLTNRTTAEKLNGVKRNNFCWPDSLRKSSSE